METTTPLAQLAVVVAASQGASREEQMDVFATVNPYAEMLRRWEAKERFHGAAAAYLLELEHVPGWVRDRLPWSDLALAADPKPKPEDVVGVLANADVFCCWCRWVGERQLRVALYALRDPALAGQWVSVVDWDSSRRWRLRLPHLVAASEILMEVDDGS